MPVYTIRRIRPTLVTVLGWEAASPEDAIRGAVEVWLDDVRDLDGYEAEEEVADSVRL